MSDHLKDLLDEVYESLLAGRFDGLSDQTERLEAAISTLSQLTRENAADLRERSLRNERCLRAALTGMQEARLRIQEIRKAAAGLMTYDSRGATAVLMPTLSVPKRA